MPTISIKKTPSQDQCIPASQAENEKRTHENDTLDEGLRETFPASDPIAVSVTHIVIAKK